MIVEQLDLRGRVAHRHRIGTARFTVGRGYDNDLILDDPYADPHHLEIVPNGDGRLEFTDLNSTNGTWDPRLHANVTGGVVRSGLELRVGRTLLRFSAPEAAVAPTRPDPARAGGLRQRLLDPRVAIGLIAAAIAGFGVDAYLGSREDFSAVAFLTPGMAGLLIGMMWAGSWALVGRLVSHRFRFLAHLAWTALVGLVALAVRVATQWLEFLAPSPASGWLVVVADFGLVATLLAGHLWLVADWDRRRRWRAAILTTAAISGIVALLGSDEMLGAEGSSGEATILKPLAGALVPARSSEDFFRTARGLKAETDRLADEDSPAEDNPVEGVR